MIKTIAILGVGKLGVVLGQLATQAGYTVYMAGSGSVDKISLSVKVLVPGAIPATATQAIDAADAVMLAIPLGKYQTLPRKALGGKLVIDAMNYWWEVDGDAQELLGHHPSSSQMIQSHLPQSKVVKALSHMGYHHLRDDAKPSGAANRKAIAIATDHQPQAKLVAQLVDSLGFDPLLIGPLSQGIHLEPSHPAFGANLPKSQLQKIIPPSSQISDTPSTESTPSN